MAIMPRRNVAPRMQNYRRARPGLRGWYGLGAACDPMDVACVMNAAAAGISADVAQGQSDANASRATCKSNAALNGQDGSACDAQWPSGWSSITPATSGMSPQTVQTWTQTPQQAGAQYLAQQSPSIAAAQQIATTDTAAAAQYAAGAAPSTPIAASMPVVTPALISAANTPAAATGFSLSAVPWWGWLAAAGVAFVALKGKG